MGMEAETLVRVNGEEGRCKVFLEPGEIICRGPIKRRFPHASLQSLAVQSGLLTFVSAKESVSIELGDTAETWRDRILNPRSRIQKLGVKPGMKICLIGPMESDVPAEIENAAGGKPSKRLAKEADLVLLFAEEPSDLARLADIEPALGEGGAVWVLYPKGRSDLRHEDVVSAAASAKLVQTKSLGFSDRLTGLRLTRPRSVRSRKK